MGMSEENCMMGTLVAEGKRGRVSEMWEGGREGAQMAAAATGADPGAVLAPLRETLPAVLHPFQVRR